jgi:hypothetical protein
VDCMKALVYALAGCLALGAVAIPAATACEGIYCPPTEIEGTRGCAVFSYWLEPQPGYQVDPSCL